jgi:hypothetical protein
MSGSNVKHRLFLPSLEADPLEVLLEEGSRPDQTKIYYVCFKGQDRGKYEVDTVDNTEGLWQDL